MVDYKWRGLQRLRQNLGDAAIDYQQHGGYELFTDGRCSADCIDKISYLNKLLKEAIGHTDIYSVADAKIAEFGFNGVGRMIYNPYEGQIHTGKMMRALLNKVYEHDILVLNGCEILAMEHEDSNVSLKTSQGYFKARKVILATNAFASQLFPELKVIPGRGQVLVTKPIDGLKLSEGVPIRSGTRTRANSRPPIGPSPTKSFARPRPRSTRARRRFPPSPISTRPNCRRM